MSTTPEKKSSETLGVKEAMQHYVSTIEAIDEPATTIKKLTKQVLDPDANNENIQKARTIAQIWEAAAQEGGGSSGGTNKVIEEVILIDDDFEVGSDGSIQISIDQETLGLIEIKKGDVFISNVITTYNGRTIADPHMCMLNGVNDDTMAGTSMGYMTDSAPYNHPTIYANRGGTNASFILARVKVSPYMTSAGDTVHFTFAQIKPKS